MPATSNQATEYARGRIQPLMLPLEEHASAMQREQHSPPIPPERLATTERLLVSGEILFSLAHEINTALLDMLDTLDLLQHEPITPSAQKLAAAMIEAGNNVTRRLQSVLALTDHTSAEQRSDVDHLLQTVIDLLTPLTRDRSIRIVSYAPPALELPLSLHEAQQVLLHLLMNSVQAIAHDDQQMHTIWVSVVAWDTAVVITVRDDGPGIPELIRPYIFDPFFSTKPATTGTGLGLPIVRSIIQRAGGDIAVTDTRPGHTTFTAWLPRRSSGVRSDTTSASPTLLSPDKNQSG